MVNKIYFGGNFGKAAALAIVSGLAFMGAGPVFAQTATPPAAPSSTDSSSSSTEAQPAAGLDEIVVTAQRRSELLQDVPIAITTANAVTLEREAVTNVRDLASVVPGMRLNGAGANITPAIRGVEADQNDPGNDANVATYVDGIYMPSMLGNAMDLPDISRVEVLKGPQGTLYGRNASGGAIRIFTVEPTMDTYTGQFNLGYGNYNDLIAQGYVTGPLIQDVLAGMASVAYEHRDGIARNLETGDKTQSLDSRSVRLKLKYTPMDFLSIEAFGSYAHRQDGDSTAYTVFDGNTIARGVPGAIIATQPWTFTSPYATTTRTQVYTGGLKIDLDTEIGNFESTSGYYSSNSYYYTKADLTNLDLEGYPLYEHENNEQEELIWTPKKWGSFQFVGGAFYYHDVGRYDPLIFEGSDFFGTTFAYTRQGTIARAGFGELTWEATDRLTLLAGARYSSERRDAEGCYCIYTPAPYSTFYLPSTPAVLPPIGVPVTFTSTTPRASVRYRLTEEDDNIYFTYAQGFKAGGFNVSALQPTPFLPEKLTSYEIGVKTSPQRMFSANVSAFYYDYKDKQTQAQVNGSNITNNAAALRIYGADADISAKFTHEFSVTAGVAVLSSKYESYPLAPANAPIVGPNPNVPCLCGNMTVNLDLSGQQAPQAPKFSASITPVYVKTLEPGTFEFSATGYYTTKFNFQASPRIYTNNYGTLALRASFQPTGSNFNYYVWGKNVTSTHYIQEYFISGGGDGGVYAPPATYGVGVKYKF